MSNHNTILSCTWPAAALAATLIALPAAAIVPAYTLDPNKALALEDIETLDSDLAVLETEIKRLRDDISVLDDENLDLVDEIMVLEADLSDVHIELVQLRNTIQLPATGQVDCFDMDGDVIACAGTGQDAEYLRGVVPTPPRYIDNGDGSVTDTFTGLVWLQNADCIAFVDWNQALWIAGNMAQGACGLWDGSQAGDWRLPNVRELHSLVDFSESYPALEEGHPFTGISMWNYCTSTSFEFPEHPESWMTASRDDVYKVNFAAGDVNLSKKSTVCKVWLVRDGN